MTENEAIKMLEQGDKYSYEVDFTYEEYLESIEMGRKALEEIQQYRAIGTVEEFKVLKEKAEPKKIVYCNQSYGTPYFCPECNSDQIKVEFAGIKEKHTYCWKCGQKIDWSE